MSWSSIGGEAAGLLNENHLAADGIDNVIKVLEELEDEKLQELDFIELNACAGGCVGGIFAAENGYVARARIQRLRKYLPVSCNRLEDAGTEEELEWTEPLEYAPVMKLARKCGRRHASDGRKSTSSTTGSPSWTAVPADPATCRALAEDIVRGTARESDCIFRMRRQIQDIASQLTQIEGYLPPEERPVSVRSEDEQP